MPAKGRLGGHFVTGHIDSTGKVQVFEEQGKKSLSSGSGTQGKS